MNKKPSLDIDDSEENLIKGIKCDNPSCDFSDDNVAFESYPQYVNKPCPKCKSNLLTKKDYDLVLAINKLNNMWIIKTYTKMVKKFYKIFGLKPKMKTFSFNGTGKLIPVDENKDKEK